MPLVTSIPVTIFVVGTCIAFYVGFKKLRQEGQKGKGIPWYQQFYLLMGITTFLLAVFFLLIGLHDMVSEHNTVARLLIYILAGIMFIGAGVSCLYMLRRYPSPFQKNKL